MEQEKAGHDVWRLKAAITYAGYSQRRLAAALGISKNTLCAKVNGKSAFKPREAEQVCRLLGIEDRQQIFPNRAEDIRQYNLESYIRWRERIAEKGTTPKEMAEMVKELGFTEYGQTLETFFRECEEFLREYEELLQAPD